MNNHKELIIAVGNGDKAAFHKLYTLLSDKVYNTALSYSQNPHDAEEITQDVFVSIFRNASRFKGDSTLSTWVYRITVNTALNHLKRKRRSPFLTLDSSTFDQADFEHPGVLLEKQASAKALFKAIDTLPDAQKMAFILSFVEELPRQEVADIMETSLKAVESLLQRAKSNLRERLKNLHPDRRKTQ